MIKFCTLLKQEGLRMTLNDLTFTANDIELLGNGSEKRIWGIKGTSLCFFTPAGAWHSQRWENAIKLEKSLCDEVLRLGVRAQDFKIMPIRLSTPSGETVEFNVLVTKPFKALAEEENLTIFNVKARRNKYTGKAVVLFEGDKSLINDMARNRQIIKPIIKEFIIALTYKLPIYQAQNFNPDDSIHYVFKYSKFKGIPPKVQYMFWDMVGDFVGGAVPLLPTILQTKNGFKEKCGMESLMNDVACAYASSDEFWDMIERGDFEDEFDGVFTIQKALFESVTDEMLEQALLEVRQMAVNDISRFIERYVSQEQLEDVEQKKIAEILKAAISIENLPLIEKACMAIKDLPSFCVQYGQGMYDFAKTYNNEDMLQAIEIQFSNYIELERPKRSLRLG